MRIFVHYPARLSVCFCRVIRPTVHVQTYSTSAKSDISGWLWLIQRRWSSCSRGHQNIISGVEYATNLITATELLRVYDSNSRSFSLDNHEFGGMVGLW